MAKKSASVRVDFAPEAHLTQEMMDKLSPNLEQVAQAIADEARASTAFQDYKGTARQPESSKKRWSRAAKKLRQSITVEEGEYGHSYLVKATANHAHLIEYGHAMVTKDGKKVGEVQAYPFLRPAADKVFARLAQFFRSIG